MAQYRTIAWGAQSPEDGKAAVYDAGTGTWVPGEATGGGGGLDTEAVQDAVAAMLTAGTGVTLSYDDGAGTLTITATAGGGSTDPEIVRDVIGAALVAGTGVSVTVDDAGDTITLAVSGLGISDVSGLQAALDGKAATSHTHDDRYYTEGEVDTALAGKAEATHDHDGDYLPAAQTLNAQTGTAYTLAAGDAGKVVTATNASPVTLTVPASTFTAGQRVDVLQSGAGSLTLAAGAGMTLHGTPSLVTRAQWSAASVLFLSATEGVVIGDLATP